MMAVRVDITGHTYGKLHVIELVEDETCRKKKWLCRCECGNLVVIAGSNLRSGHSTQCKQCGLLSTRESKFTHRQSQTKLYRVWHGMLTRCGNPNSKSYPDYGGRGIAVCDEWHDAATFLAWAHANGYHEGLEIDRIDNDGNYCPENCHWIPKRENAGNKRSNRYISHNGETKTLAEWARYYDVNYKNLSRNLLKGYTLEDAVAREKTGDRSHRKVV